MRNIYEEATITGKRQITIPKRICDLLNIQEGKKGQRVIFRQEDNRIIFEVDKDEICFVCEGTGKINDKECFICLGTGNLEKELVNDVYKLITRIIMNSLKYRVDIQVKSGNISLNNSKEEKGPVVKIESEEYPLEEIRNIEYRIQKMINKSK